MESFVEKIRSKKTRQSSQRPGARLAEFLSSKLHLALTLARTMGLSALLFSTADATPRLTISNPDIDFGVVPMNCELNYQYWLHSSGSSDLIIEWTDGSCPCAQLPLAATTIAPGDSVAFELIVFSGRVGGALSNKPKIKTNADKFPVRTNFSASVVTDTRLALPIGTYPFRADLSAFGKYRQDTAAIEIINHHTLTVTLEMIYERPEYFSVILPGEIPPGGTDTCLVILNPDTPEPAFAKSFTIEGVFRQIGDVSERSRLTIPVRRKTGDSSSR